jgi:hypothetical protein
MSKVSRAQAGIQAVAPPGQEKGDNTMNKRFETIHATMTKDEKFCWSMLSALGRSDEAYRPIAKQVFEGTLTMAQANLWLDTKHGVVQTTV